MLVAAMKANPVAKILTPTTYNLDLVFTWEVGTNC